MVLRSTSDERTSAATKFWSFSRKAQSLATHRSSLSRHQPVYWGSPSGAAVLAFWTLTSLPRQPVGRAECLAAGLYAGYLDRFVIPDGPFDHWLTICAETLALNRRG